MELHVLHRHGWSIAALARAETAGLIVTPVRGSHVIVPLEDRGVGAPSWRIFLDPMMEYLGLAYYVPILLGKQTL